MAGGGVVLFLAVAAVASGAQPHCDQLPEACHCEYVLQKTEWVEVSCDFTEQREQNFILNKNMLPEKTKRLHVTGAFYMIINRNAFSDMVQFEKLDIKSVRNLTISSLSFENMSTAKFDLNIHNSDSVVIESASFLGIRGGIQANISNCDFVELENNSFTRVISVDINNVPRLHLHRKVFQNTEKKNNPRQHHNKVSFYNVTVNTLEEGCFSLGVAEVTIIKSNITTISSRTFEAMEYGWVIIENTEIATIEVDAFRYPTFLKNLTFYNCSIWNIESGAINTSSSNLNFSHSGIDNVRRNGISLNVANVNISDNKFVKIESGGINLSKWNALIIERNVFEDMSAIVTEPDDNKTYKKNFKFSNNYMEKLDSGTLSFINNIFKLKSDFHTSNYSYNHFNRICSCQISDWLKSIFGESESLMFVEQIVENSFCAVHRKCNNFIIQGHMQIPKYIDIYCNKNKNVSCIDARKSIIRVISNLKFQYNFPPLVEDDLFQKEMTNRLLLWLLFGIAIALLFVTFLIIICIKSRQKSQCTNVKNEITSCFTRFDRMFGNDGIDSVSISRVSINDYNENHMLQETTLNEDNRTLRNADSVEDLIDTADKATQTLPEELTKELLESLRERLDDPENYSEARETIEHLYDLIKVEEYCNMNNNNSGRHQFNNDRSLENLYDVIQQPLMHQGKNKKSMVSVGTKVPSLEKLTQSSPYSKLCHEYFEPRDRTVHLYSELTPNKNIPNDKNKSDALNYLHVIENNFDPPNTSKNANQKGNFPPIAIAGPSGINMKNATQRSNKSNKSGTSDGSSMVNRPLPEKPRYPS